MFQLLNKLISLQKLKQIDIPKYKNVETFVVKKYLLPYTQLNIAAYFIFLKLTKGVIIRVNNHKP